MKRILIFVDWYLPGYKGGGQIKAVEYIVKNLSDRFDFYIICRDHDSDGSRYEDIQTNEWLPADGVHVKYLSGTKVAYLNLIAKELSNTAWDAIYTNSFFSLYFSIFPLLYTRFIKRNNSRFITAPRGEFSPGALGLKKQKKQLFIGISGLIGLHRYIMWHVSTALEEDDVRRWFPRAKVVVASELLPPSTLAESKPIFKAFGEIKLIFLSRISPIKGLDIGLRALRELRHGEVRLDIYGPVEDADYWKECLRLIESMPANVTVKYCGEVRHSDVKGTIVDYHFLLFPTLGENFGYVIIEAFLAGRPVLISNTTPWADVTQCGVGHDFESGDIRKIGEIISGLIELDDSAYRGYLINVNKYATYYIETEREKVEANAMLFFS